MSVPSSWRWLSCQFGEEFCFNATQVDVLALRVSGGYVFHEGQLDVIQDWACLPHYEGEKRWPERIEVSLTTRGGKQFALQGQVLTSIPVLAPAGSSLNLVTESRGLYRWHGREAYGMIEFMEQLT